MLDNQCGGEPEGRVAPKQSQCRGARGIVFSGDRLASVGIKLSNDRDHDQILCDIEYLVHVVEVGAGVDGGAKVVILVPGGTEGGICFREFGRRAEWQRWPKGEKPAPTRRQRRLAWKDWALGASTGEGENW